MKKTNKFIRRILLIIVGCFIMAIGSHFFLFEAKIASGGVGGLSILINEIMPIIETSTITAILNVALFIIGFITLGKEFAAYSITGTAAYSGFLLLFARFFNDTGLIVKDPLVNLLVGSGLVGIGLAFVFYADASTGGTDIIAKLIDKYTSIGIGSAVMVADSVVIIAAAFILGIEKAIYGLLALIVTTVVINKILTGFNVLIQMTIISSKIDEINTYITKELNRGTTLYKARGGYTGHDKEILMTIVGKSQYLSIKNKVSKIDDKAFVFVNSTNEVIGEGFTREAID